MVSFCKQSTAHLLKQVTTSDKNNEKSKDNAMHTVLSYNKLICV